MSNPPVWPVAPTPPAAPVPSTLTPATGQRDMELDAFYTDERNLAVSRSSHPVGSFYNVHTKPGSSGYSGALMETVQRRLKNPLNDPAVATVLTQTLAQVQPQTTGTKAIFEAAKPVLVVRAAQAPSSTRQAHSEPLPRMEGASLLAAGPDVRAVNLPCQ